MMIPYADQGEPHVGSCHVPEQSYRLGNVCGTSHSHRRRKTEKCWLVNPCFTHSLCGVMLFMFFIISLQNDVMSII